MPNEIIGYLSHSRALFPEIDEAGHCQGNSFMAMQALLTSDLNTFIHRLESIYYGVKNPAEPDKRITMDDLHELKQKLNLKITHEKKDKDIKDKEVDKENKKPPIVAEIKSQYEELKKLIDLSTYSPPSDLSKIVINRQETILGKFWPDDPINPKKLKRQINLAWKIREAFLEKNRQELIGEGKYSTEEIQKMLADRLKQFNESYPYISELTDIETYFSNVALYQAPYKFPQLFEGDNRPKRQRDNTTVLSMLAPVHLTQEAKSPPANITKLTNFSSQYSYQQMEEYFISLEKSFESQKEVPPFALVLCSLNHAFTIGYNSETKNWILIDANDPYPREIPTKDIAHAVFKTAAGLYNVSHHDDDVTAKLLYNSNKKEFIYVATSQAKNTNSTSDIKPSFALALSTTDKIKKLTDLKMNINTEIYTSTDKQHLVQPIIQAWKDSAIFKAAHNLDTAGYDDIHNKSLLQFACLKQDDISATIHEMIQHKIDINQKDSNGFTALLWAAGNNCTTPVRQLLENKADPDIAADSGYCPLICASENNCVDSVKLLIEHRANINIAYHNNDQTSLYTAVYCGKDEVVDTLLKAGAERHRCKGPLFQEVFGKGEVSVRYNFRDSREALLNRSLDDGTLLLLLALKKGNKKAGEILVKHGADVNTALILAIEYGQADVVRTLIKDFKADVNCKPFGWNYYPLFNAIDEVSSIKNTEIVKLLIEAQADVNLPGLLFWAVQRSSENNLDLVQPLIDTGKIKNIDEPQIEGSSEGENALMRAANTNQLGIVNQLLDAKADPNNRRMVFEGLTVLHFAALGGTSEIIETLVKRGAKLNEVDSKGQTPLYYAANRYCSHPEVVKTLLNLGAESDLTKYDNINQSTLYKNCRRPDIKKILEDFHANYMKTKLPEPGIIRTIIETIGIFTESTKVEKSNLEENVEEKKEKKYK